jgi:hypothetical protein
MDYHNDNQNYNVFPLSDFALEVIADINKCFSDLADFKETFFSSMAKAFTLELFEKSEIKKYCLSFDNDLENLYKKLGRLYSATKNLTFDRLAISNLSSITALLKEFIHKDEESLKFIDRFNYPLYKFNGDVHQNFEYLKENNSYLQSYLAHLEYQILEIFKLEKLPTITTNRKYNPGY